MGFLKKVGHKAKAFGSKALMGVGGFMKSASNVAEKGLLAADIVGLDLTPYGMAANAGVAAAGALGDVLYNAGQSLSGAKSLSHGVGIVADAAQSAAGLIEPFLG